MFRRASRTTDKSGFLIRFIKASSLFNAGELHLSWYHSVTLYQQILKYQRVYLASHVLYGSSRLGTKDYLPDQIYSLVDYQQTQPLRDTTLLNARIPWYSGPFNDVIQPGETSPWDHTQNAPFSASERTGEKQYELSNHLGNVQATVSDNPYAAAGEDDSVTAVHPALKAAYDYYPFGMLMPDRYVSDTSEHCLTVSRPQWSWQWVFVNCYDVYEWPWNGFVVVAKGSATKTGDAVSMDLPEPGDGVSFDMAVTPHAARQLVISAKRIDMNDGGYVQVLEPEGEGWTVLAEAPVGDGENMVIPFIPGYGNIRIAFWGRLRGLFYTICDQKQEWVAEEQLVTICDDDKDKYRWGFNGQEKINEWSGIGNYLDFGARGLDSRTGRWLSVDPLAQKYPGISSYTFVANNPIWFIDPDGKKILIGKSKIEYIPGEPPPSSLNTTDAATWNNLNAIQKYDAHHLKAAVNSDKKIRITSRKGSLVAGTSVNGKKINFDPYIKADVNDRKGNKKGTMASDRILDHELRHAIYRSGILKRPAITEEDKKSDLYKNMKEDQETNEEYSNIKQDNEISEEINSKGGNEPIREDHGRNKDIKPVKKTMTKEDDK